MVRTKIFLHLIAFSSFPARATHPRYQEHRNRSSRHKVTAVQSYENFGGKHGFGLLGLSFNPGPRCSNPGFVGVSLSWPPICVFMEIHQLGQSLMGHRDLKVHQKTRAINRSRRVHVSRQMRLKRANPGFRSFHQPKWVFFSCQGETL